jgi:UDP-glucose:(heptosyl)LPS alpha-1,3-glucosyltransferase
MSETLKVGVVIPKYGLVGGGEKFVYEITERLARDPAFDVHVFANRWRVNDSRASFHRVPIITFPRFFSVLSFAWFAARQIEKVGIDVIHTHERIFEADVFTMHGIPHRLWIKTVRKKHMSLFDRAYDYIERRLVEGIRCRHFQPVSELTREAFMSEYDCRGKAIEILYPGIDPEPFTTRDRAHCRNEIRRRYGFSESDRIVLFVSMNFEIKGLDHLMEGIAAAKQKVAGEALKLLVVGKGNVRKFEHLATTLGIADDVVFAGVCEDGIEQIYLGCDIFSMLSRFDTFGLTVLEAMAASLPVLISHQVGARDLVTQGENGYVVERTDKQAVSRCLRLLVDDENMIRMGRQAHLTARQFRWEQPVDQLKTIYRSVGALESRP